MGIILNYLSELNVITRSLIRGRQEGQIQKERFKDATPLVLKVEGGSPSQGMQAVSKSW